MRRITISDDYGSVTLLSDIEFTWKPQIVGEKATMASGKTVMDVTGVKNKLQVPTGWLSPSDLALLRAMIVRSVVLTVAYPTVDGDKTDLCYVSMPEFKSFKYDENGVSQWYGVTLEIEQVGVDAVL